MTKHLPDLHRVDELKNFVANNLFQIGVLKSCTGIRAIVNHIFGAMHQKGELSL